MANEDLPDGADYRWLRRRTRTSSMRRACSTRLVSTTMLVRRAHRRTSVDTRSTSTPSTSSDAPPPYTAHLWVFPHAKWVPASDEAEWRPWLPGHLVRASRRVNGRRQGRHDVNEAVPGGYPLSIRICTCIRGTGTDTCTDRMQITEK